jgi:hypothetical protein
MPHFQSPPSFIFQSPWYTNPLPGSPVGPLWREMPISVAFLYTSSLQNLFCFMQQESRVHSHKAVMLLQNCIGVVKAEPGSCSEQCVTSSHGEDQVKDVKVEDDVVIEEVEDPLPVIDEAIQSEHEVGFVCVHYEGSVTDSEF